MESIRAATNNIILTVGTKYIGNISNIMKVAAIENNSSVDPSDLVQIIGDVISVPKKITTEARGYEGYSTKDIQVGDVAIFRFDVIYDFKQISDQERIYKNLIWYKGKEFWSADIRKIFGVIRDGKIHMINGYVMISDFINAKIILPAHIKKGAMQANVMHIGSPKENQKSIDVKDGDTVFFNPNIAAKYQINGKPFRIIQQDKILGKEAESKIISLVM